MKLTSDLTLEFKNRKVVTFFIEDNENSIELALKLCDVFNSADIVVRSHIGEHRLPNSMRNALAEMTEEIRIQSIEIGESRGFNPISFIIKPSERDLICYGPADYNFYNLLKENNMSFKLQ